MNSASASLRSGMVLFVLAGVLNYSAMGCRRAAPVEPKSDPVAQNPPAPEEQPTEPKEQASAPEVFRSRDKATFLGTHAVGERFCIIADASNSMKGPPMNQLKREIMHTLNNLKPSSQFYIIFFNATDIPMPHPTWLSAEKENVEKIRPWVQGMGTVLKTWPSSSFDRAFKLEPKPDAIFFMTDGFIPAKENIAGKLAQLNVGAPKTVVHTILFAKGKAEEKKTAKAGDQLRVIAEKNGGTFRRVSQK